MNAPAFAVVADPAPPARRFRLLAADEIANRPPLRWRVKGVLPETGVAAIYGPSASGKSFLSIDLAAAIAAGRPWFGRRTKACAVSYLALEGEAGIASRVSAYRIARGRMPDGLHFATEPFSLLDVRDVPDLADTIREAGAGDGVTIIDTLARAAAGADENSGQDMGYLIAAATELQRRAGGLVLMVHHSGKDANRGARGHSSLFAALDAAIEVTRTDSRREWKLAKAKDGEDGRAHPFRLEVVEVGEDEDGDAVTSCVVREDDQAAAGISRKRYPSGDVQRIVFDAICELLKRPEHFGKAGAPSTRPCIELDSAVARTRDKLTCDSDQRAYRARRAITSLVANGFLACSDDWIWLP